MPEHIVEQVLLGLGIVAAIFVIGGLTIGILLGSLIW